MCQAAVVSSGAIKIGSHEIIHRKVSSVGKYAGDARWVYAGSAAIRTRIAKIIHATRIHATRIAAIRTITIHRLTLDPLDQDGCQKQNRTGDNVGGKSHD